MIEEAGLIAASSWVFKQAGGTELLARILGPSADELGLRLRENFLRICNKSKRMLDEAGIEPEPVHPRVALPLLKSAVLEDDEGLQEMWAALLANAAIADQRESGAHSRVPVSFPGLLSQLDPNEAALLHRMCPESALAGLENVDIQGPIQVSIEIEELGISQESALLALHNFSRMALVRFVEQGVWDDPIRVSVRYAAYLLGEVSVTYLGRALVAACRAPVVASRD